MAAAGGGQTQMLPPEQVAGAVTGGGVIAKLEEWQKTKEHAQTYPYVWGSYILVYGGLGAYLAWRWHKLRRTEDRVHLLQDCLRKLSTAEESHVAAGSASTASTPSPPQQSASGPAKPTYIP